jgi:hypothetical protein
LTPHEEVLVEGRRRAAARDRARARAHEAQAAVIAWVTDAAALPELDDDGKPLRPSYSEIGDAVGLSKKRISQMVRGKAGRQQGTDHWRGVTAGG